MNSLKKIMIIMMVLFTSVALFGCDIFPTPTPPEEHIITFNSNGGSSISEVEVENGKLLEEPVAPTKEEYVFSGWYIDEALTEKYDFNSPVTGALTLYAKWDLREKILVIDAQLSSNLVEHNANKEEKQNKKTEFFDLTKEYVIGDDNAWDAKPEVSFVALDTMTGTTRPVEISTWEYVISVIDKDGNMLDLENTNLIDAVDLINCTVDFSEAAIGNTYTVSVVPTGLTDKQLADITKYTTSFSVKVVDGYNLYNAKELAYVDNRSGDEGNIWNNYKKANGLMLDYYPTSIILHKSIKVTDTDLPSEFFWQASELNESDADYSLALGSMKDYKTLYHRNLTAADSFNLIGNYFTLSVEQLREVVRSNNELYNPNGSMSHSQLFRFEGDVNGCVTMEDLNIIGNAPRVGDVIKAGGIIMNKVEGPSFTIRNCITACCFISFFPNYTKGTYLIDKCKAYDSFNSFVYNWGADKVTIKDSEMIGAGGPIIIQDHVNPSGSGDDTRIPNTTVINSNLESYVTGTEGWFNVVGASMLVPQIKSLDKIFNTVGRSFLTTSKDGTLTYFNFICVNKSGDAEGITASKVSGSLTIDGSVFDYGESTNKALSQVLALTFTMGAPAFQSSVADLTSGYGFTDGTNLLTIDLSTGQPTPIADPNNKLFAGDHLGIYFQGMMFVLGYGPMGITFED